MARAKIGEPLRPVAKPQRSNNAPTDGTRIGNLLKFDNVATDEIPDSESEEENTTHPVGRIEAHGDDEDGEEEYQEYQEALTTQEGNQDEDQPQGGQPTTTRASSSPLSPPPLIISTPRTSPQKEQNRPLPSHLGPPGVDTEKYWNDCRDRRILWGPQDIAEDIPLSRGAIISVFSGGKNHWLALVVSFRVWSPSNAKSGTRQPLSKSWDANAKAFVIIKVRWLKGVTGSKRNDQNPVRVRCQDWTKWRSEKRWMKEGYLTAGHVAGVLFACWLDAEVLRVGGYVWDLSSVKQAAEAEEEEEEGEEQVVVDEEVEEEGDEPPQLVPVAVQEGNKRKAPPRASKKKPRKRRKLN